METFYFNWYNRFPYVHGNSTTETLSGLFPPIMEEIFTKVCGVCRRYGTPNFRYFVSRTGEDPAKQSEYELKRDISEFVDVSYPIYSQPGRTFADSSEFVLLVKSSGCSLIVRDTYDPDQKLTLIIEGILQVWPFLVISYIIASTFGALTWLLVSICLIWSKIFSFCHPHTFVIISSYFSLVLSSHFFSL